MKSSWRWSRNRRRRWRVEERVYSLALEFRRDRFFRGSRKFAGSWQEAANCRANPCTGERAAR